MAFITIPVITTVPNTHSVYRTETLQKLEKCATLSETKQIHSRIIRLGLSSDNYIVGRMIKFCCASPEGDLCYARKLFDGLPQPDTFIYNILIKGYLRSQMPSHCMILYLDMLAEGSVAPNHFTFPYLIRACSDGNNVEKGRQLHAQVVKWGFGENGYSLNNLIFMYMGFGLVEHARLIFDRMPQNQRSDVSWTTLISGYARWGLIDEAFEAALGSMRGERNSSAWNALIAACVQHGRFEEAFDLFNQMRVEEGIKLDRFIATSMLSACSGLGALAQGEKIHEYVKKHRVLVDAKLLAAIVDMYCKCGCLEKGVEVFNSHTSSKGISAWNCMIGGLAINGKGKAAIELFKEMEKDRTVVPDRITFLHLLAACAHSGLVAEGQYYFQYMKQVYGAEPEVEHFGCMVDMLGRSGLLSEAAKLVDEMPVDVGDKSSVLGALFGACKIHGNVELGEAVGRRVIDLDPGNSGRYVLLANLYACAGRWEDVVKIRKLMDERGVRKIAGYSTIEWDGKVDKFIAGERNHPESKAIYAKLDDVMERIKSLGYLPKADVRFVDEENDEKSGHYHSERLAIVYGLIKTKPEETIRVTKNLRVCEDCHEVSKYISKAFGRVLIVRDRKRFHRFKNGECSCKDYW